MARAFPDTAPDPRDLVMVRAIARGNRMALARAYDRFGPLVYNVALRFVQDETDAADLVQDVFRGLPRAVRSFEGRGRFDVWLRRVTVRRTLMHLRRIRNLREHEIAENTSPAVREVDVAARIDLERALAMLDADHREVFLLKVQEGYRHVEIAELLGISVASSKSRLFRARRILRRALSAEGSDT